MSAPQWYDLPDNWRATGVKPSSDDGANFVGLRGMMSATIIWRNLTRPQRELLLSACAGWPVKPRTDVKDRLVRRGLVDEQLKPTDAGRFVVKWRLK